MQPRDVIQGILELRASLVTNNIAESQVCVTKLMSSLMLFRPDLEKFYAAEARGPVDRLFAAAQELARAADEAMRALAAAPTKDADA